ncbi:MAG: cell surface protein SprA [Bacteroidales bacterium]
MSRITHRITFLLLIVGSFVSEGSQAHASQNASLVRGVGFQQDTTHVPTWQNNPYLWQPQSSRSAIQLDLPENVKQEVAFDASQNQYIIQRNLGSLEFEPSKPVSFQSYNDYYFEQALRQYWQQRRKSDEGLQSGEGLFPNLRMGGEAFNKIFGSNTINIVPQGSAELIFGININEIQDPKLSEKLRKTTTFDFQEKIQMNVSGSIGEKIRMGVNYNTEATFDFENQTKLAYEGDEDEIIQKIEAGNVTLPLPGSLITGSQSLFGVKTELKFGNLSVTSIFSQQKGETKVIEVKGGAQTQPFQLDATDYDANRHFFLAHYFRENYNQALDNLPIINSAVNITKVEVWITNKTSNFESSRNIVALTDLGETGRLLAPVQIIDPASNTGVYPDNQINEYYNDVLALNGGSIRDLTRVPETFSSWTTYGYQSGQDYEKVENARKLSANEYTLYPQLGYLSLKSALNSDEVLAVAYEYTVGGQSYQVGEFSTDGVSAPDALLVKLIKGTNLTPRLPSWDLMMKNIYAIGAYQVNKEDFILNILYRDDNTGNKINYLPEGNLKDRILLEVLNLDNINSQNDQVSDGRFDFMDGVTINASNGRVIFPLIEPFGKDLRNKFDDPNLADKYVFEELYDSTLTKAEQVAEKNKFMLSGEFKGSNSSEIPLNALNIPQGSVVVTAGGRELTENVDYTVDYNLGRVNIINQGLMESGTPIQISLESNSLYSIQTKTLMGTHLDYRFSDNFNVGATVMNLTERPLTQKVGFGEEPISNTIWGFNTSYYADAPFLTRLVDKLPFIETKEASSIAIDAEFAHLSPGHSKAIKKEGNAYIDDFEGSETSLDMKNVAAWVLSSIPQGQPGMFPEAELNDNTTIGYNRAKLAWYKIDPLFLRNTSNTPGHIKRDAEQQSSHFVREIYEKEIFPNKDYENNIPAAIQVLNLAYYPDERGPYNYDTQASSFSAGLNADGTLRQPESRWGGIMREVPTSDFEAANIEYIEFWVMDPFVYDEQHGGGYLYFNLGDVSEDILKDGRKSFENGFPETAVVERVDTTAWGRVPLKQSLVNSFSNSPEARQYQDIGLDGLNDEDEASFFADYLSQLTFLSPEVLEQIAQDPSNDNYHYYRGGDYDAQEVPILERYKKYNGLEGNSPTAEQSPEPYPTSGSTLPNVEDINLDNTLNETESYYQYRVWLHPQEMEVGRNYITDKVQRNVKLANGEQSTINWYQFKIPVREPERKVGAIEDFKSIRFMRMFMRGFSERTILRFAKLDLVRGEWRRYTGSLLEGRESSTSPEYTDAGFEITAVNIEENASKTPVNYVIPPGIDRVIDPANPQLRQLNEQAIVLKVRNLDDGDARAAFKTLDMDIRQYRKIKMFTHIEAVEGQVLNDNDLRAFVRLGTDYTGNYYEYEIPLKVTLPGNYDNNSQSQREEVWPLENEFVIDLEELTDVKLARNAEVRRANSAIDYSNIFTVADGDKRISVSGNPNLSSVRTIMIGIRNPSNLNSSEDGDDGLSKSAEIWFNELRLTDFREAGGWAAKARISAQLADFGTVNLSGHTSTPGFGSIEKKVGERSHENIYQYDVSTNLNLGKFFPEEQGVSIPMYANYSEGYINPEYNPLDPDIKLKKSLDNLDTKSQRDSLKDLVRDYTQRKSINFTNVKVEGKNRENKIYSPANVSLNYSYYETYQRNINTEYSVDKRYRGGLNYIYNMQPNYIRPFQRTDSKLLRSNAMRLIRDFNFNLIPSNLSFRTQMDRQYNAIKTRNINNPYIRIEPTYNKEFMWTRQYDLKWEITRGLSIEFMADNISRIDEPEGIVDKERNRDSYDHWRDSVWSNILDFGRNTSYHHILDARYRIPINKLPMLDWVSANARYNATYNWDAGPVLKDASRDLGNNIRNSNTLQINGQLNTSSLYNKVGWLKDVQRKYSRPRDSRRGEMEQVTYEDDRVNFRGGVGRSITHELNTEDVRVQVTTAEGVEVDGTMEILSKKRIRYTVEQDLVDARVVIRGRVQKRTHPLLFIAENIAYAAMSAKSLSISYSETRGTSMPGYKPTSELMGLTKRNDIFAPGIPFVMGWQDPDFAYDAIQNGWITQDTTLNTPFLMTQRNNLTIRAQLEPFRGLKINLTANRTYADNTSAFYLPAKFGATPYSTQANGNFSMSYISLGTAFEKITTDNNFVSGAFEDLQDHRRILSQRLAEQRGYNPAQGYDPTVVDDEGFHDGYGGASPQVLIPSFLAAYGVYDPQDIPLNRFPMIPLPNWSVTFSGLKEVPLLKRFFRSVNISHAYRSTYSINSFINNPDYEELQDGFSYIRDLQSNFIAEYEINAVSINEQFSPLINLDMTWNNNLTTRFEVKKSRTLTFTFSNNQLSEVRNEEYGVSLGYRFDDLDLIFDFGGENSGQQNFKSDLNVRGNFKLRDTKTVLRKVLEDVEDLTDGQKAIIIGVSADYMLTNRFTVRFFYDRNITDPFISRSYPSSNTSIGFSFRFTLTQ